MAKTTKPVTRRTASKARPGTIRSGRERVGVRELRQNLSVHLRRVTEGAVLEVTDRGRPVAMLTPLPERMTPLQRLEAQGLIIRRASVRLEDLGPPLDIKLRVPLSEILEELRADRV